MTRILSFRLSAAFLPAAVLATLLLSPAAFSAQRDSCDIRKANIEKQLSYAKAHGNQHRIQGLERALHNVTAYCTPDTLRSDAQEDVRDREKEVAERKADLQKAINRGDPAKIEKRERKLAEAEAELKAAQNELNALSK